MGDLGASFLVTPSRRTHPELLAAVDAATATRPRILWNGRDPNPYADFLAQADVLIATADSVNMCSEIAATGRPAYVFMPEGGTPKFNRFHQALCQAGATRPLPSHLSGFERWAYEPLEAGRTIATEIEQRFADHQARLARSGS